MSPSPENPPLQRPVLEEVRLVGDLVILRPIQPDDARAAFRSVANCEEVLRWSCWEGPEREEELRDRYADWRKGEDDARDYQFAICEVISNRLVGALSLRFGGHPGQGDLGYWIDVDHWGRGFAGEAIQLINYLAFGSGLADVLYGWVFVGNEASKRVLEKNGYLLDYTTKSNVAKFGQEIEQWYLVQTSSEWLRREGGWRPQTETLRVRR